MKSNPTADIIVSGKGGKRATEFQLVTGRFLILGDQIVVLDDLVHRFDILAVHTDKAVKHRPSRKHIDAFCTPRTTNLKTAHTLRDGNAEIDLAETDFALIVFIFLIVLTDVRFVRHHKPLKDGLLVFSQTDYVGRNQIQNHNASPYSHAF